ncbi:MAG: Asp23/Gls24 family envelope stress response protein [Lachnospiraceae bacterium]|nr:Asp23/Gls24 family envelope stress response protein [Lachnospiraceae bacterium]
MKSSTTKYSNKMTSINTSMGNISIDNEAIAQYAGSVAMECFGVVGMAGINMRDGLVKLLKLDSMTRGINVMVHNNKLVINFHIIVAYGVSILAVSNNLISNVKYKVEEFTGIEIEKINIFVEGVKVID